MDPKPKAPRMVSADTMRAGVFPVKVEAIVKFVQNPQDAFAAIIEDVRASRAHDGALNEGVHYSFTYGGIKHDVTLTAEDPI